MLKNVLIFGLSVVATVLLVLYLRTPEVDTISTTRKVDTVTVWDTLEIVTDTIRVEIPVPVPVPADTEFVERVIKVGSDTVVVIDTLFVKEYVETYEDSLLTGTFRAKVKGDLLFWDFLYSIRASIPTATTHTTITESTTKVIRKGHLGIGLMGGYSNTSQKALFAPTIGIVSKRGDVYAFSYELSEKSYMGTYIRSIFGK